MFEANKSDAAPYLKAAVRDVKAYRESKNYRKIPIGYSAGKTQFHSFQISPAKASLLVFNPRASRLVGSHILKSIKIEPMRDLWSFHFNNSIHDAFRPSLVHFVTVLGSL